MTSRILLGLLVSSWVLLPAGGSAQAQLPCETGTTALIRVLVPSPNANLWFDNTPMPQQGSCRLFVSPPLDRGKTYTYTVKASWLERGRKVSREKLVKVRPGRETVVDFTVPEAPAEQPLTPPIVPESEQPLTPPIAPEPSGEQPSRHV